MKLWPTECHFCKGVTKCDKCHHDWKGCTVGQSQGQSEVKAKGKGKGKAKAKVIEESSEDEDTDEEEDENKPGKSHIPYL